ncbi:ABC transporter substrate-binding protein [Sedimentibacter sp.]|uniref:ABC transporter substrate-binding protein n=1 Tax=Sedimentibacter sp. TaxID=1960295 RepID=UPI0028A83A0C|nr:ABC transporter substrate-binding protein [Sedimentibacter sp.]
MKKITKSLLLFICCMSALLLISCGADNDSPSSTGGQPAMGRYVEKDLKYPVEDMKGVTSIKKSDGSIDLYMYLGESPWCELHNTKDGIEYEQEDIPWFSELAEKQYSIYSIGYDTDGSKYILVFGEPEEGSKVYSKVYRVTGDDRLEEIKMEWQKNSAGELRVYMREIKVASNGDLLFSNVGSGIEQYSTEGKFKNRYGGEYDERFTVSGDSLFIINEDSSQISIYDLNTYEKKTDVNYDHMTRDAVLTGGSNGSLYLTDRSGVYRLVEGGSLWEKIIEGELTSLSIPSLYFGGAIEAERGEFYILYADSESNNSIFKYEYDENISTVPGTELTVYTLNENSTLRQTAGEFQRKNPDIRVNIMIGIDEAFSVTKDDALKALNTEIMAGKGPDLILLDGMDVESYISKGVLADLSGAVKKVNGGGEKLVDSAVNVYEQDLKIFAVPAKFTVPSIWIDEKYADSVKTLRSLAEFAKSHNDRQAVPFSSYMELIKIFSMSSGSAWFDKNGNLDEKAVAEFLVDVKGIYDSGKKSTGGEEKEDERSWGGTDSKSQAFAKSMSGGESNIFDWAFGRSYAYCSNLKSYNSVNSPSLAVAERKGGIALPLPGQAENVFIPVNIIGINARTEKFDIAEEFVSLMLSSSVQNARTFDGFPVNIKSLEHGTEGKGNEDFYFGMTNNAETEEGLIEEELAGPMPSAEELKKVMELCLSIKTPYVPDDTLLEMIIDETEEYFAGNETAEQAASKIKERTRLYLSE